MRTILDRARWRAGMSQNPNDQAFPSFDETIAKEFTALWNKYRSELAQLALLLSRKCYEMNENGFSAAFGDIEGELLYILVRELRPRLVYEISPNSGYSTNYLLAAVTRNGEGRVEGFEIQSSFNGLPAVQVIAENQVELCDFSRYRLNIGDARQTIPDRLKHGIPDFCLIDSWHEDVFADFYVGSLFPRLVGTILVQDIAHFDPRPEWATEAYYLLSHLQLSGSDFVPLGTYEDALDHSGVRSGLASRRPMRSNAVLIHFDQERKSPAASPDARYKAAWGGLVNEQRPMFCDVMALSLGRASLTDNMARSLVSCSVSYDQFCRVLVAECLARSRKTSLGLEVLGLVDLSHLRGAELPLRAARAAFMLGARDVAHASIEQVRVAAKDPSLATGYRQLIELAALHHQVGEPREASVAIDAAVEVVKGRGIAAPGGTRLSKGGVELVAFCLRHPAYFSKLREAGFDKQQISRSAFLEAKKLAWSACRQIARGAWTIVRS